jgi:hypothetical protein
MTTTKHFGLHMCILSCVFVSGHIHSASSQEAPTHSNVDQQSCLEAGKQALGPDAQILKCGHLTGSDALEAVAAIHLKQFRTTKVGIAVSKFVVLRREKLEWTTVLTADQEAIRNTLGYIGADFINDSDTCSRYRVSFYDEGSHEVPGFTIVVSYFRPDAQGDAGAPVEIAWNRSVGRFQEYNENQDPLGFQAEKKDLPHIRTAKAC